MIDARVRTAIKEAAQNLGQPETVAMRLISWLEALSDGNAEINDRDETRRRCELIYDAAVIPDSQMVEEA